MTHHPNPAPATGLDLATRADLHRKIDDLRRQRDRALEANVRAAHRYATMKAEIAALQERLAARELQLCELERVPA